MITKAYTLKDLLTWQALILSLFLMISAAFPQDEVQGKRQGVPGRRGAGGTRITQVVYR